MRIVKIVMLFALLGSIFAGLFYQKHVIACELVMFTNYQKIGPHIYASPNLQHQQSILKNIENGRKRVNSLFGEMQALPKIVLVANAKEAAWYGANSTGKASYSPWGTCIVLGPKGQNVDVTAHELVHAEVANRVGGWFTHWMEIPIWFNEGVALMVDHRAPFLVQNIDLSEEEIEAVKTIKTAYQFFKKAESHKNYLASRLAVKHLEPSTLYQKLERIREGENFESVFESLK
ncbi:MAG: hypothetical protein AAGB12_03825 [Pseudomonadota bacterium]